MASIEYQNIFTQVQVQGPPETGMAQIGGFKAERTKEPWFSKLAGWFGNAQIGPIHLGFWGALSFVSGGLWFFIIGMNINIPITF